MRQEESGIAMLVPLPENAVDIVARHVERVSQVGDADASGAVESGDAHVARADVVDRVAEVGVKADEVMNHAVMNAPAVGAGDGGGVGGVNVQ